MFNYRGPSGASTRKALRGDPIFPSQTDYFKPCIVIWVYTAGHQTFQELGFGATVYQMDPILLHMPSVIDHKWHQNETRKKKMAHRTA